MRSVIIALVCVNIFFFPTLTKAEHNNDHIWRQLNELADKVLQLAKQEKYAEAKEVLTYFSKQFLQTEDVQQPLSMTDLNVLTMSYDKSNEALTSTSLPYEERIRTLTQFRLIVDAINTNHQPLWRNMEQSVLNPLSKMRQAIESDNKEHFHHYLNQFLSAYEHIRPALVIDLEEDHLSRLDSLVSFLDKQRSLVFSDENQRQQVENIEVELTELFKGSQQDNADPSLPWLIITIGGVIVSTLIYVGWRKYNAEKKRVKSIDER
jgi:sporulation protein YpjB